MANRRPSFWRGPPCACPKVAPDLYLVVGRTGPGDSTARGRRHGRVSAAGRGGRAVGSPENGVPKEKGDAGRDGVPRARRDQRRRRGTPYVPPPPRPAAPPDSPHGRAPPPHRDSAAAWTTRVRLEGPTTMSPGYLVGCLLRGRAQLGVVSSRGWAVSLNWTAPWMGWKRGPGRWPACGFEPSRSPMGRSRSGIEPL